MRLRPFDSNSPVNLTDQSANVRPESNFPFPAMTQIFSYLTKLTVGRSILWCYLIWYLVMGALHFDPSPELWLTSVGLGLIIGYALTLSVASGEGSTPPDRWQLFRLYLMPFCVSSFSALVKDHGFILIFSPSTEENGLAIALCAGFMGMACLARRLG